jgi:DNA modification methylase
MNLSENEKRDIIKYLEAGKSLPEKYRFLLFKDDREVELVWNGKTSEVTNVVLPFQVIEQIDEPREGKEFGDVNLGLFDTSGKQITGWTNKLIWGDNKLILSSLNNGPMRKEIEAQGGLKLIYIDPPFDVGADFSMDIEIGEGDEKENFTKKPSVIEEVAYRDTWGKGADSFIAMIYERLKLMHDLLAEDGSIYVHCDYRVSGHMRLILDEVFGKDNFINEIIWDKGFRGTESKRNFQKSHETIFYYVKSDKYIWNQQGQPYKDEGLGRYNKIDEFGKKYALIKRVRTDGTIYYGKTYPKDEGKNINDVIGHVSTMASTDKERLDYPTQKPEDLMSILIKTSSNEGDLIADFFCGSGTTLATAEKLGRKWIGSDLGKFGVHTTRKRMIGVQRELKKEGKDFRAFELLNVGRYERDNYLRSNNDLRAEEKNKILKRKEREFVNLILSAYKAEPVESFDNFVGKKRDRLIAVGPVNMPVSSEFIELIVSDCIVHKITKVDVLGFDYEMGLDFSKSKDLGIDIEFKIIPREVFDKRAIEKGQVKFYDVAYLEVDASVGGKGSTRELTIELKNFSASYNQDDIEEIILGLKPGGSKIILDNGNIIKIFKEKDTEEVKKEILTKKWSDWVDYWAVDFDFESRKEIIKKLTKDGKEKEVWTGDYIFDNEWQSFRTKRNRNLELTSAPKELVKGNYKIAVKVVDIFGNDTTKVIEVKV